MIQHLHTKIREKIELHRVLGEDDFSDAFVKMVTELANTIGVHVCVEGVETDRQYAIIKKMGIYYIQGYFFDKPMCIESFEEKYI